MRNVAAWLALLSAPALAQHGTTPKAKASDYPSHAVMGSFALGAEFMVRAFGESPRVFHAESYLVVEVALFATTKERVDLRAEHFTLRLNGKKAVLMAQSPGIVAASLKYPDWEYPRGVEASAGAGPGEIVLGRPRAEPRFPGDNRGPRTGEPTVRTDDDPNGSPRAGPGAASQSAVYYALPEGVNGLPMSGYLYFRWSGKPSKLKSVELLYRGPAGDADLKLK